MKKLVFLIGLLLLLPAPAHAQTQNTDLTLSPVKTVLSAQPGQTIKTIITVQNTTSVATNAAVAVNDFVSSPESNGEPRLLVNGQSDATYGLAAFFTGPKTLRLGANKKADYTATFAIPKNTAARTYFTAVRFTSAAPDASNGLTASLASLVFISVGSPSAALTVKDFAFNEPTADKPAGSVQATLENTGDGLYEGAVSLSIKDASGKVIEQLEADKPGSVLPTSSRIFNFTPKQTLPAQVLTAVLAVAAESGSPATSKELTIDLAPDPPAAAPSTAKKTPIVLYAGIGAAALAVLVAIAMLMRRKKKQVLPAAGIPGQAIAQQPQQAIPNIPNHLSAGQVFHPENTTPHDSNPPQTPPEAV